MFDVSTKQGLDDYLEWTMKRQRHRWQKGVPELPKDHATIPDIDLGMFFRRQEDGALQFYLQGSNLISGSPYVVLGKYAHEDDDRLYYVTAKFEGSWGSVASTHYFKDLIPAIAKVVELKEKFDVGSNT